MRTKETIAAEVLLCIAEWTLLTLFNLVMVLLTPCAIRALSLLGFVLARAMAMATVGNLTPGPLLTFNCLKESTFVRESIRKVMTTGTG